MTLYIMISTYHTLKTRLKGSEWKNADRIEENLNILAINLMRQIKSSFPSDLYAKIKSCFPSYLYAIIKSYLQRTFRAKYGETVMQLKEINSGVP